MTLTTVGFDGSVTEAQWAAWSRSLGSTLPVVLGRGDFAVSINGAATRTVTVATAALGAMRHGLLTTSDAAGSVVLDDVTTTGQSRWDAVVLHSDWSTNTVTLTKVNGTAAVGAARVLPSALVDNPGVAHDHVLALVQITHGSTLPTAVQNRRLWPSKGHVGSALAELPPASAGLYGTRVNLLDGSRYTCLVDGASAPAWIQDVGNVRVFTGSAVITTAPGWTAGSPFTQRGVLVDNTSVQLDLTLRRTGSTLGIDASSGNFPDTPIGNIGAALWPDLLINSAMLYFGSAGFEVSGMTSLAPDGTWTLKSGIPGQALINRASGGTDGNPSIRASFTFIRQGS